jgi:hypothetical protein
MSYLCGPLTKDQVARLEQAREGKLQSATNSPASGPVEVGAPASVQELAVDESQVAPSVAAGVPVSYLDPAAPWATAIGAVAGTTRLRAFLAARVALRYDDSTAGVDEQEEFEALYGPLDGTLDLDSETQVDYDERDFAASAPAGAVYALPGVPVEKDAFFSTAAKEIRERLVDRRPLELQRNRALKVVSRPGESPEDFAARCDAAAQARADAEAAKIRDRLEAKGERLDRALAQAERRVEELETDTRSRRATELVSGAGAVLGALFGGRRSTRSMAGAISSAASRRGVSVRSAERKETAEAKVESTQDDLAELEQEIADEITEIDERWRAVAAEVDTLSIRLEATDVRVVETRLVWVPAD